LTILKLCNKKNQNKNPNNIFEVDGSDLEKLKGFTYSEEYLLIHNKILAGKTLQQWFSVNDLSYWWFVDPIIAPKFDQIVLFIDRLEICINNIKPNLLKLDGHFDKYNIVKNLCIQKNIRFEVNKKNFYKFLLKQKIKKLKKKTFYGLVTKKKYKKRIKVYDKSKHKFFPTQTDVIFTSYSLQRKKTINPSTGKSRNEEFFLTPIIDELKNNDKSYFCIDLDYTLKGDTSILDERIRSNHDWIPIDILLNEEKSEITTKNISILKKSIKELVNTDLEAQFLYKNISIWKNLEPWFDEIFLEPYLPSYVHLIEKLETFLKILKPKMIIQIYETGPLAKAFVIAGKNLGIKTIAIQHGNFLQSQSDYMMKNIRTDDNLIGNPISDSTLVFGEHYKKMLHQFGNYPLENIHVIGNLSLYNLEKIKNVLDRKKLLLKNKLPEKKIILFALSFRFSIFKDNPDIKILKTLYEGLKNDKDTTVLIRPHPGDKINQSIIDSMCPGNNFVLSTENSNFEDIFLSDVVILYSSTLGIESALFGKIVIYTGEQTEQSKNMYYNYIQNMISNDVAQYVSLKDLICKINSIEKGTILNIFNSPKQKKYLEHILNFGKKINLSKILEL
jgi:hypothetical protein